MFFHDFFVGKNQPASNASSSDSCCSLVFVTKAMFFKDHQKNGTLILEHLDRSRIFQKKQQNARKKHL